MPKVEPKRSTRVLARRVERLLQIDVERPRAEAAAVHRAQHLDVADRVEAEARRDPLADDLQDLGGAVLGIRAFDEMKVAVPDPAPSPASAPD